ncbi:MAG TPA: polysaccharide deacetylase family protein, partial [Steroidobacteraceae bacterium]
LSDLVGTRYSFWPNRLARLLGDPRNGDSRAGWPDWLERELRQSGAPAAARPPLSMTQIDSVIANCKARYTDAEIGGLVDSTAAGGTLLDGGDRDLMNWDEIRQMAAGGQVRFGSHTRRHTRLDARAPVEVLRDEIEASRGLIEQQLRTSISSFCYPNGDHCPAALDLVRRSYATAVTTRRGWNSVSSDTHLLNRVGVHEDVASTAAAFVTRLARAVSA